MIDLTDIENPEEIETMIKNIPHIEIQSITKTGIVLFTLNIPTIKIIKKEILKYIDTWKKDLSKYNNALSLIESIVENYKEHLEIEENYLSSMKSNLRGIQRNINKSHKDPSSKQQIAINNLENAISSYQNNAAIDKNHFPEFSNQPHAENDLWLFIRNYFGEQYPAEYYSDINDYYDRLDNRIKNPYDTFDGDLNQDRDF